MLFGRISLSVLLCEKTRSGLQTWKQHRRKNCLYAAQNRLLPEASQSRLQPPRQSSR